jgi:hypothetical protein
MNQNLFEPADYAIEELSFTLKHLRESPNVALHDGVPAGVNPLAVKTLLGRLYDLEELRTIKGVPWGWSDDGALTGFDAIEDSITRFIKWQEKCLDMQKRGGPRHPSQHTWDSTGAMSHGGIGSDASEKVRSEITDNGERRKFAVMLHEDGRKRSLRMPWQKPSPKIGDDAITLDNGVYTCSICQKPIASFDIDKGRPAQNKARKTVREHIRQTKSELQRHRSLVNVPIP